ATTHRNASPANPPAGRTGPGSTTRHAAAPVTTTRGSARRPTRRRTGADARSGTDARACRRFSSGTGTGRRHTSRQGITVDATRGLWLVGLVHGRAAHPLGRTRRRFADGRLLGRAGSEPLADARTNPAVPVHHSRDDHGSHVRRRPIHVAPLEA